MDSFADYMTFQQFFFLNNVLLTLEQLFAFSVLSSCFVIKNRMCPTPLE